MTDTSTTTHTLHGRCSGCGSTVELDVDRRIRPHQGNPRFGDYECSGPRGDGSVPLRLAFLADPADPRPPTVIDDAPDPTIEFITPDEMGDHHRYRETMEQGRKMMAENIPPHYRNAVVTVPEVADWVRTLVRSVDSDRRTLPRLDHGRSLLLLGPTGTGKTFTAYGIIRALSVCGVPASWRFLTAADFYAKLRPRQHVDSEEEFEKFAHVPVLVLDDLGAAKGTEWNEEINYRLINTRYENERPTIVTSNVPPKDLGAALGERVASRLVEMADRVVLRGADRRIKVATPLRATS